jgi:hypothetical protein
MAKEDSFTPDEWNLLRLAPTLVAGGMSAVEPSGIFGSIKEDVAGASGMGEATKAHAGLDLFTSLDADRSIPGVPDRSRCSTRVRVLAACASATRNRPSSPKSRRPQTKHES